MSVQRKLQRSIDKSTNDFLKQHRNELPSDWATRPQQERNLLAMMARNGITQEDMKREIMRTKRETYELTVTATMKIVYSAMCLVLFEDYNFKKDDCFKVLRDVDNKVVMAIDDDEIIKEMEEKVGIRFNSRDGLERIEQV